MLFSLAVLHMFSNASIASAVTLSSLLSFALMAKGILRVRITVIDVCAITLSNLINIDCKYRAF